jgi:hypothetical protein
MKSKTIDWKIFLVILFCFTNWSYAFNDGSRYATESVLVKGKVVQLKVTENAVYKLTYDEIKRMGFNDPAKVKIYGYGGWILDQDFTKPYIDDLPEVSVWINKGSDGIFNAGDYLLFYGRGIRKWTYNTISGNFEHQNNPYANFTSYFVVENEEGLKEMSFQDSYANTSSTVTTFDDYTVHEQDLVSLLNSGRELFGESFAGTSNRTFSFNIPVITNDPGRVQISFAAQPAEPTPVIVTIGDEEIIRLEISNNKSTYRKANLGNSTAPWTGNKSENTSVRVSYNASGISHLNFLRLNMKRNLRFYNNGYTFFRAKESLNTALQYTIDNASSSCLVWDISDIQNMQVMRTSLSGNKLSFGSNAKNYVPEYVMIDYTKPFLTPEVIGEIKNQNLHALPQTDMVIIAPEPYFALAEILAEKHRQVRGLHVTVVQPEWIYNEFSSGTRDATAYRRFMKMFYDRATNADEKPKYLLLYGDGIFDNRHLTTAVSKMDPKYYLLTYQFQESLDQQGSFGTDDYFGFLDDNEGLNLLSDVLDLGIGRFPVSTYSQAQNALNKVLTYMDNKNHGQWKNSVIFAADDTDSPGNLGGVSSFCVFGKQSDGLTSYMENNHPQYMVTKSYMDAFQSQMRNGQTTYPDAKNKVLNALKDGSFLMNYIGHGSITAMSSEDMMNVTDIRQMRFENLPVWITATCEFGWFDGVITSAGEEVFLNRNSAGIALYTTSRVVGAGPNLELNTRLINNLFNKQNGKYLSLGDVARKSKVEIGAGGNKLNFVLLGDPALILNYPEYRIVLENVNGEEIPKTGVLNFKALDNVVLEGVIVDETGEKISDFNGDFLTTVFDSRQTISSLTVGILSHTKETLPPWTFTDYSNVIYKGSSEVKEGRFSVSFRVPLDISYDTNSPGKIGFYASDKMNNREASGSFLRYTLSGTNENFEPNNEGPKITKMFLNSESFENGGNVNETPFFVAEVFDEDGINRTGSGLGHDITICIDNHPAWTYNLNANYQAIDNERGIITFSIPALPSGEHELLFRVWDILNNSSTASLSFNVVKGLKPQLYDLTATGNPVKDKTYFLLSHNMPETPMEMEIQVYDVTGRTIWTHKETGSSEYLKSYQIEWDLKNNAGSRVSQGIYIYRAVIKTAGGQETTQSKKLIVLEQ